MATEKTIVYVSNSGDGDIGCFWMSPSGALDSIGRVEAAPAVGPLAIDRDRRFLIASSRSAPYTFHTYAIDAATGTLTLSSRSPAYESFPYIHLDMQSRFLLAASYSASLVTVNGVDDEGRVDGTPLQVIPVGRHAHAIRLDETGGYAYVPALGSDQVFQFSFDDESGRLTSNTPAVAMVAPGTGPRHLITSSDNRFLYVLNEMHGTVTTFAIDDSTGLLSERESVLGLAPDAPYVPGFIRGPAFGAAAFGAAAFGAAAFAAPARRENGNEIWAADLHLTPDGRFLYICERTSSTIGAFSVDRMTGKLTFVASTPTELQPRGFAIDPSGCFMVVSGEKSETVSVYSIDATNGALSLVGRYPGGRGATWVEIVNLA